MFIAIDDWLSSMAWGGVITAYASEACRPSSTAAETKSTAPLLQRLSPNVKFQKFANEF